MAMKFLIFAGTTEGRMLIETFSAYLHRRQAFPDAVLPQVTACVATEYGKVLLPADTGQIQVRAGRLDQAEMEALIQQENFDLVIDTTHPYAVVVTDTIKAACEKTATSYLRLLRQESGLADAQETVFVRDTAEAAAYLNETEGNVLLTTGSKELEVFTKVENFAGRLYARVLPMTDVIAKCAQLGYPGKHIIAMQGPFSAELNTALLKQIQAAYLVTKDSGTAGGFEEKAQAARQAGAKLLVIGRREGEEGESLSQVLAHLEDRFGLKGLKDCMPGKHQPFETEDAVPVRMQEKPADYFPLFISLKDKNVLVIGAGAIAARRIRTLLSFSCHITVVAQEADSSVLKWAGGGTFPGVQAGLANEQASLQEGQARLVFRKQRCDEALFEWLLKSVQPALVLAATDDRKLNGYIAQRCGEERIPVSTIDRKEENSFYFPGIIRSGDLVIGVTASGTDHRLAKRMTETIRQVVHGEKKGAPQAESGRQEQNREKPEADRKG